MSGFRLSQFTTMLNSYLEATIEKNETLEGTSHIAQMTAGFGYLNCFKLTCICDKEEKCLDLRLDWEAPTVVRQRIRASGGRMRHESMLIKRIVPTADSDAEHLIRFASDLSAEVDPGIERVCELVSSSLLLIDAAEDIDDVFIRSKCLVRTSTYRYPPNSTDFSDHWSIIANLMQFPEGEVVPRQVRSDMWTISLSVSTILTPVSEAVLNDLVQRKVLLPQLVELTIRLFVHQVLPCAGYFYMKPLSQRVVVVPTLSRAADCQQFLRRLLTTYWGEMQQLRSLRVYKFPKWDYDQPSLLFGEVEVMENVDVRDWNEMTLWRLRIPFLSHFHVLLWKHHSFYFPPANSYHSSSSELQIREGEGFSFSTGENETVVTSTVRADRPNSGQEETGLLVPDKLSHAPIKVDDQVQYYLPLIIEYQYFDMLADIRSLRLLPKLGEVLEPLHQRGKFHGLITPATVRFGNERCYLSLAALDWISVPLLYWAVPTRYQELIAPEVRALAEGLEQPSTEVDFTRADAYGVAGLIAVYGEEECKRLPALAEVVRQGQAKEWRERPPVHVILAALSLALSHSN